MGGKRWAKQEIDFIKENYNKIPVSKIAVKISRSKNSIRLKKRNLGLIGTFFEKIKPAEKEPFSKRIVGYSSLHDWIRRRKSKPEFCENCNLELPYDLANISGLYKRDINDFKWLCRRCHMKDDGRIKRFMAYRFEKSKRDKSGRFIG